MFQKKSFRQKFHEGQCYTISKYFNYTECPKSKNNTNKIYKSNVSCFISNIRGCLAVKGSDFKVKMPDIILSKIF